jgi:GWxTD domain-containing protein
MTFARTVSRFLILLAAFTVAFLTNAAPAAARGFVLQVNAFMGAGKVPSVRFTADIPYASLVFLKEDGRFRAQYSVAVTIRKDDRKNEVVRTTVFDGDAVADYYEDTHSRERRSRPSKVLPLSPGEYSVEAILSVKNTHIRYQRVTKVIVPDFLASGMGFGTPAIFFVPFARGQRVVRLDDFDKRSEMTRVDAEMIGLNVLDAQPVVSFELFLSEGVNTPLICSVYYEVRDAENRRVLYGRSRARIVGDEDAFVLTFDAGDWKPGAYSVNLRAAADDGKMDARSSARLDLDVTHSMLDEYFEDTLEILSIIATSEELHALETATPEMRVEEWHEFWQRRDPNPATAVNEALEELLKRIREATRRFSKYGRAWKTDRGQVYIRFGEPDKIERTADGLNRGEYEVWTYFRDNRRFVFFAQVAGGQFRLVEGDLY